MKIIFSFALISALSLLPSSTNAAFFYVEEGATGTCDESDPCGVIQQALDLAAEGDSILIGEGTFYENLNLMTPGLILRGASRATTIIESAGGQAGGEVDGFDNPSDIIVDIFAPNSIISEITVRHPAGPVVLRDLGILCRPPAINTRVYRVKLERQRTGAVTELPTRSPGFLPTGSRGLIAFQATGIVVVDSLFVGNYQDPLHIPSSYSSLIGNTIFDPVRVGLIIVDAPDPRPSVNHLVVNNIITGSTGDGIQIHGDSSLVVDNTVEDSVLYGIHTCGDGTCLPPGVESTKNYILDNDVSGSGLADFADFGSDNLFVGLDTNRDCTQTDPCDECAPRDCDNDNQCLPDLLCADQHKAELKAAGLDKRRADCGPATDGAQPNWEVCYRP